jgi:hypothetical protein
VLACLLSPMAVSATSPKDIKIGVHVIDFVTNPPAGKNVIGVLFDSKVKESADDAQIIFDSLTSSLPHGANAPTPVMVDIRDLDDAQNLRAVLVADHMKPHYDKVSAFGHRTGALILSADLDCVRSNKCTVGIASAPRVEVIVSSKQAQASGIQFSEAFRMMVTEY